MASYEKCWFRRLVYVHVLYFLDCRPDEALRIIKHLHLDLIAGIWRKPDTKPGEVHEIPIPVQINVMLSRLEPDPKTGRLFPWHENTVRKWFAPMCQELGIVDLHQRDLRRSCASELLDMGTPLPTIQEILGHDSLSATQHYLVPGQESMRRALQARANLILGGGQLPLAI